MSFWASVLGAALGASLTLLGQGLVQYFFAGGSRLNRWRREDYDEAREMITQIELTASELFLQPAARGDQKGREADIMGLFVALTTLVETLFEDEPLLKAAVVLELNRLEDSITYSPFGMENRAPAPEKVAPIRVQSAVTQSKLRECWRKIPRALGRIN